MQARRLRLTELYSGADPKHDAVAIKHHQALLRTDHDRVESYAALRSLYGRSGELDKARACDDALIALGQAALDTSKQGEKGIESLFEPSGSHEAIALAPRRETPQKPLGPDDWTALARVDVDPQLSVLFAIVASARIRASRLSCQW